jgi:hypothetical protein
MKYVESNKIATTNDISSDVARGGRAVQLAEHTLWIRAQGAKNEYSKWEKSIMFCVQTYCSAK